MSRSHSILLFLLDLDLLHVVKLLLVVIEGLRLDGIPCGGRRAVEILLESLVGPLTVLNQLLLTALYHFSTLLLCLQFLSQELLIVLLLTLFALEVHLL